MKQATRISILTLISLAVFFAGASCIPIYSVNRSGYVFASEPSGADEVLALVNRERQKGGLPPLAGDPALSAIAQNHAEDMARRGYFEHESPEGMDPFDRLRAAGISYRRAGENIACRTEGARSVVRLWMGSPGHRKNILGDFTRAGIGAYRGYYVLLLVRE
jgi:uncharacterized protein YkwD